MMGEDCRIILQGEAAIVIETHQYWDLSNLTRSESSGRQSGRMALLWRRNEQYALE
jgi:hypothetical protein